jgi:hypothetical protein
VSILALDLLTFAAVWAVGFGARAAWTAGGRRRARGRWFAFGAVLGPVALAILDVAPPGTCAACLSPVSGWSMTCAACGEDVRAVPRLLEPDRPVETEAPTPAVTAVAVVAPPAAAAAAGPVMSATASDSPDAATAAPAAGTRSRRRSPSVVGTRAVPAREAASTPKPPTPKPVPAASSAARPPAPPASFPGVPVFDAALAQPRLDLDLRRPMRLASCIFVEGTIALLPGTWYQLSSEGGELSISGPPGSFPNGSAMSRPLSDVQLKKRGDRLVITGTSGSDTDFRLAFRSTLDWTPLGITQEVDARRQAWGVDAATTE